MRIAAATLIRLACLGACMYLILQDHPWFALLFFCGASGVSLSEAKR